MIEESARVTKVDNDNVWIQAIAQSACGSCQAQKGCGHSLLAKVGQKQIDLVLPRDGLHLAIDDYVIIGVPEQAVLRSSLIMYGLPLLVMMVAVMFSHLSGFSEPATILLAFVGLVGGFVWVNKFSQRSGLEHWQPKILRKALKQESHIPICEVTE